MAKAELKTKKTEASVEEYLSNIADEKVREDSKKIVEMMEKATGAKPKMWGGAIIGFGERYLKYESGRELDWMEIGFSPRKQNLTLYVLEYSDDQKKYLEKLGKHKTGKGCLYIKRLSDVDENVLEELIENAVEKIRNDK